MLKKDFSLYDNVFYGKKSSFDNSVIHSGDNTTGVGKADDEVIRFDLSKISEEVAYLFPVITIFSGGK
jgi:tellurium resistance protein TerZ